MKTITNFVPKSVLRLPALTLLFAAVVLLLLPQSMRAQSEKPFNANFITQVTSVIEGNYLHLTVDAKGRATCMGKASAFTDDQLVSLIDGSGSATYTLTALNGDTLVLALVVAAGGTINVSGGVIFSGSYTVTGGTGQFSGASGGGVFGGTGLFLSETDGIGAFALVGTLSH